MWSNFTEHLLNAGGWPQISRKANQSLWNEVGQKIKMKRKTKDFGTETHPGEGAVKEKFPHNRKPFHRQDQWGVLESQRTSKPKKFTEIIPNSNYQPRSGSHARISWLWKPTGLNSRRASWRAVGNQDCPWRAHSQTHLHQVSGQRQELAKYLGHTRESHWLILGCVPEGQGSGGTFFGDESTGRHHFPFTLLPSCWPSAGGCHFLSLWTRVAHTMLPAPGLPLRTSLTQPTHLGQNWPPPRQFPPCPSWWAALPGIRTPPKQLPLQGASPAHQDTHSSCSQTSQPVRLGGKPQTTAAVVARTPWSWPGGQPHLLQPDCNRRTHAAHTGDTPGA